MLVFWKERLVFLAVPKTGSTAFESALRERADIAIVNPPGLKHAPLYRYNRFMKPLFGKVGGENLQTIAVIRDPLEWLGSWYRYRSRSQVAGTEVSTENVSFDDFVRGYMQSRQPAFARVGSQARFVSGVTGQPGVTHLFRYDQQDKLKTFLQTRLKMTFDVKSENVSPRVPLDLSPGVETRLRKKYAQDFALWESLA